MAPEGNGKPYTQQSGFHMNPHTPYRAALLTYPGNFRQALEDAKADPKKTLLGVAQGIPSAFVSKLLASTRPDFIWMDVEHGMYDRLELFNAIQAAQHHSEGKAMVIVRVTKGDPTMMSTALDAGAAGIVIPHTETADEVRAAIKEMFYPPMGQRSFSPWTFTPNISDDSLYEDDSFNIQTSNRHIVLIPQIESVRGVENMEEIASIEGVGGLMLGPGDFMLDAGIKPRLGGVPDPKLIAAMTKLSEVAKAKNLALFGAAQSPEMIPMLANSGYAAIAVAFDYWGLTRLVADGLKSGREALAALGAPAESNGAAPTNGTTNGEAAEKPAQQEKEIAVAAAKPE
jgi:4-hydroxy-2-oxoheptanedioate aldolase